MYDFLLNIYSKNVYVMEILYVKQLFLFNKFILMLKNKNRQ